MGRLSQGSRPKLFFSLDCGLEEREGRLWSFLITCRVGALKQMGPGEEKAGEGGQGHICRLPEKFPGI